MEDVKQPAHKMQFPRKKDLDPWLVELEQLEQMNTEEQRLMQINVYPVVSVW